MHVYMPGPLARWPAALPTCLLQMKGCEAYSALCTDVSVVSA